MLHGGYRIGAPAPDPPASDAHASEPGRREELTIPKVSTEKWTNKGGENNAPPEKWTNKEGKNNAPNERKEGPFSGALSLS